MEKQRLQKTVVLLLTCLFFCCNYAKANVAVEIIDGRAVAGVTSIFSSKTNGVFLGSLEAIRLNSGTGFYIVQKDLDGNQVYKSVDLSGGFGDIKPVYNALGELDSYRLFYFKPYGENSQLSKFSFDLNLEPIEETLYKWPLNPITYYYARQIITLSNGSYLAFASNNAGVYMNKFDAEDTPLWTGMKTLDMSGLSNWTVPSIGGLSVAKMDDNNIIVGFTGRGGGDQSYDLVLFKIDNEGEPKIAPIRFDWNGTEDALGGIVTDGQNIFAIGSSRSANTEVAYFLTFNSELVIQDMYAFAENRMGPSHAVINPDGLVYFVGGYGKYTGTGEGDGAFGWINAYFPSQNYVYIHDFGGVVDGSFKAIDWTPTGAIFGGSNSSYEAIRGVYTDDVVVGDTDFDGDGFSPNEGDCDDDDPSINPGAEEICGDGIDQDCDGADLICPVDPGDIDCDGDGYTPNQGDCNDNDPSINPGAEEICGDGIDQDCDGSDMVCPIDPGDVDGDNDGYTPNQGDCDDNDPSINPGAEEICGDGIDQNCDGSDLACRRGMQDYNGNGKIDREDIAIFLKNLFAEKGINLPIGIMKWLDKI